MPDHDHHFIYDRTRHGQDEYVCTACGERRYAREAINGK